MLHHVVQDTNVKDFGQQTDIGITREYEVNFPAMSHQHESPSKDNSSNNEASDKTTFSQVVTAKQCELFETLITTRIASGDNIQTINTFNKVRNKKKRTTNKI